MDLPAATTTTTTETFNRNQRGLLSAMNRQQLKTNIEIKHPPGLHHENDHSSDLPNKTKGHSLYNVESPVDS